MTDTAQPTPQTIAAKFLREIFEPDGERLTDGCIAIWSKASHLTQLAYTADDAAAKAFATGWENVAYFGVCPRDDRALRARSKSSGKPIERMQGDRTELVAMPGIWIDIDVESPGHKKLELCPSVEEAREALERAIPIGPPTITVKTGGGIHAYYLFDEGVVPFEQDSPDRTRDKLERLVQSFQAMVRDELSANGWSDDQTWALPRVMRIPGGFNQSHGEPRPVRWLNTGPRYSIDELWGVVPENLTLSEPAAQKQSHDERVQFTLAQDPARLPRDLETRIEELCDIDDDLRIVWERKRRTLPSQSEIDMSLATRFAAGEMAAQDIVDLLRFHRHAAEPTSPKLHRADYYVSTLQRAFAAVDQDRERREVLDGCDKIATKRKKAEAVLAKRHAPKAAIKRAEAVIEETEGLDEEIRNRALKLLNSTLQMPSDKRLISIKSSRATDASRSVWLFEFVNGAMSEVSTSGLTQGSTAFLTAVWDATGVRVPPFTTKPGKPRQWDPMLQAIQLAAVQFEDGGESDQVLRSVVRFAVERALLSSEPKWLPRSETWHQHISLRYPAMLYSSSTPDPDVISGWERGVLLEGQALTAWVDEDPQCPVMARRTLRLILEGAAVGCKFVTVNCVDATGKRTTRSGYLRVPSRVLLRFGGKHAGEALDRAFEEAKGDA